MVIWWGKYGNMVKNDDESDSTLNQWILGYTMVYTIFNQSHVETFGGKSQIDLRCLFTHHGFFEAMGWMHSKCTSRHGGCTSSTSAYESIDGFWAEKIRLHWFKLWGSVVVVIGVRLLADAGSLYANMMKVMSHTTRPCLPTSSTAPQMLRHWSPAMLNEVIRFDGKVANISELWLRHLTWVMSVFHFHFHCNFANQQTQ